MRSPVTLHAAHDPSHVWLLSYKEWLTQQAVTSNTLRIYHSRVKRFLLFLEYANLSEQYLNDFSQMNEAMRLYLDFLKKSNRDNVTVNANINALNSFSQFLGLKDIELKREHCYHKAVKSLTADEQKAFLRSVELQESVRDKALALVLFHTGLRVGDCARLNVDDVKIEFESAFICLANGAKVPLNNSTTVALHQWLTERKQWLAENDQLADVSKSALWASKNGERLSISGIAFVLKRTGWQAQLTISAEILRRTCLANMADSLDKNNLPAQFAEHTQYISTATLKRYGVLLPISNAASTVIASSNLEH